MATGDGFRLDEARPGEWDAAACARYRDELHARLVEGQAYPVSDGAPPRG